MNNIINQLSQIEEKTVAILDGAADKKKTLAAEYEAKTKQFDEELNHETELEIQSMRQKMEAEAAAEYGSFRPDLLYTASRSARNRECSSGFSCCSPDARKIRFP